MDLVNKNFCLVPDLKIVRPKEIANDLKINFAQNYFLVCFL